MYRLLLLFLLISVDRSLPWSFPVDEFLSWFLSAASNRNSYYNIDSTKLLFRILGSIGPRDYKSCSIENLLHQRTGQGLLRLLKELAFGSVSSLSIIPAFIA